MKRKVLIISVAALLFVFLFSVEKSAALFIDLGESTIGEVTSVPLVTQEDLDQNFVSLGVPWVTGTIWNDGEEAVIFDIVEMSYWPGNLLSIIADEFLPPIELLPGETFSAPLIRVWGAYMNFDFSGISPAPVGATSGIYDFFISYTVNNGAMEYIHWTAPPGGFIWGAVVSNGSEPVPEPATVLLFSAGLAGLAGFSRRKKA